MELQEKKEGLKSAISESESVIRRLRNDLESMGRKLGEANQDWMQELNVLKPIVLATSMQFDELPSRWFKDKFFDVLSESDGGKFSAQAELISKYSRLEICYISLRKNEQVDSRIDYGEKGFAIGKQLCNDEKIQQVLTNVERAYLYFRTAEFCYYLGDALVQQNKRNEAKGYLEESLDYYKKAEEIDEGLNKDGYLDNTKGGVHLNIASCVEKQDEKSMHNQIALNFFNKALSAFDKRGVYYKQKGVALQRLGRSEDEIIECYSNAISLDREYGVFNHRNYVALGSLHLKQLERGLNILPMNQRRSLYK